MQKFTQKYAIIQLLEDMAEGAVYDWRAWPLHVTIADVFAIDWDAATLADQLTILLADQKQVTATVAGDTFFGSEKQTRVALLTPNEDLTSLHYNVVAMLERGGVSFNSPQFVKEGYLPHSTVQSHKRLYEGDMVTFDALSIVDFFPGSDPYKRKLLKTIKIGR